MNPFQHYLLDEFVEEYRDGRMSRRDFVMKAIGVSGGLAAAMGLFSSVGLSPSEVARAQSAPRLDQAAPNAVTVSPDDPDLSASTVQFPSADGSALTGYLAVPTTPGTHPGIVLIHANRGLLDHYQDVVRRYAKAGFATLAPDLLSREGGTRNADPDQVPGLLATADPQRHSDDATGAGSFLQAQSGVRSDAHGITGFCFGGGVVWRTIGQDLSVVAAVPFYGPPPPLDLLAHTRAAAFGMYGELDTRITGSAPSVMEALATAGVPHDYKVFSGANHAFFDDTGGAYNQAAATEAWGLALAWFRQYLPPVG